MSITLFGLNTRVQNFARQLPNTIWRLAQGRDTQSSESTAKVKVWVHEKVILCRCKSWFWVPRPRLPALKCLPFTYLPYRQTDSIRTCKTRFCNHISLRSLINTTLSATENSQKCCQFLPYYFRKAWLHFIRRRCLKGLKLLAQIQIELSLLLTSVQWMTPISMIFFQIHDNLTCVREII